MLLSIASAREGIPFPGIVEAIMMENTFEAIREAGVRLPRQVGSAVSIVGALVIGEAAVQAGIVSAPMIIVVSSTGIASFMVPRYSIGLAIRLLRFPIIILAGFVGLIGVMLALILLVIQMPFPSYNSMYRGDCSGVNVNFLFLETSLLKTVYVKKSIFWHAIQVQEENHFYMLVKGKREIF